MPLSLPSGRGSGGSPQTSADAYATAKNASLVNNTVEMKIFFERWVNSLDQILCKISRCGDGLDMQCIAKLDNPRHFFQSRFEDFEKFGLIVGRYIYKPMYIRHVAAWIFMNIAVTEWPQGWQVVRPFVRPGSRHFRSHPLEKGGRLDGADTKNVQVDRDEGVEGCMAVRSETNRVEHRFRRAPCYELGTIFCSN